MIYRKLRIAWSVACSIACLLLVVMWVRSYWWFDGGNMPFGAGHLLVMSSTSGRIVVRLDDASKYPQLKNRWRIHHMSQEELMRRFEPGGNPFVLPARFEYRSGNLIVHYWFYVMLSAALAAAPWIRWRFTTRTLLIATTAVAVMLGVIVYFAHG